MKAGKIEKSLALDFMLGGKSVFTLLNSQTENRFTYKVKKHKQDDIFFVSVLTGPDIYQFIGSIKSNSFKHSQKSSISQTSQSVKVFEFVFSKIQTGNLPEIIEIWHHGRCGKCGKMLTVPKSIQTGFGPECFKSLKQ
jgi:hypothetical protein